MPNSKIYFGKIKIRNIKFGKDDVKLFYGKHKNYPTSVPIDDAVVTCASAIYNGNNQVASDIVVVFSGIILVEGVDYTVTKNNGGTNIGTYEVEVTGTGEDYEGTASGTFAINKVTPTVTAPTPITGLIYNTSAQTLVNAGSTNWGTLKYSLDNVNYSTAIPSGINVGDYTIFYRVDGDLNINDLPPSSITNSISYKVVSNPTITLATTSYTYDGTAKEPIVSSVSDGTHIIPSTEYTVSYSNNINAGTAATVTITDVAGGNYTVNGSTTFTINKAPGVVKTAPTPIDGLVYNASAQTLVTIGTSDTGTMLYKLDSGSWSTALPTAVNASTAYTVYYKASASTNYNESASGSVRCEIAKVTPTPIAPVPNELTYNGSAQELVTAGSTNYGTMKYKVGSDSWSTSIPTRTRGGAYTLSWKVEGNSNVNDHTGGTVACSINEKPVTAVVTVDPSSYTYSGSYCQPTVTAKDGGTVIPSSEYTVVYSNNLNAGTATVTIYDVEGGDYYVTGSTTFTISKASCYIATAPTAKSLTYNGNAQALVNAGSGSGTMLYKLDSGSWGTSIPTATNAGSYTVYYKVSESTNYNEGCESYVSCSIAKATPPNPIVNGISINYDGSSHALATASNNVGTIYYSTNYSTWSTSVPTSTNAGSWTVYWYMGESANYNGISASSSRYVSSSIARIAPTITQTPYNRGVTYNGSAQYLLTGGTANVSGSFSYGTGTNAGSYSAYWIFNPSDTTNYYAVDGYVTATIAKASCSSLSVAAVNSTYNGSSQNLLSVGGNCGTMYYRVNSGSWTMTIPTSTNVGSWTIYCYMAESTNYNGWYSQSSPASYSCSISCAYPTITQTPYNRGVTYNGSAQYLLTGGTANVSGSFSYSTGTNAGSYTATWTFTPSSSNYCTVNGSVAASIEKAAGSVTIYGVSLTYNGNYQNLATVSGPTGTMHYSTNYSSWSTSIPTSLNAGSWTIYWYMDASTNYEGIAASTGRYVSSSMGCLAQSAPTAYGSTTTYPTTATASASGGGGQGSLEWESAQSQSSVGSHTTRARWLGNGNYCASPWSNYVTVQMNKADQSAPTATGATTTYPTGATATASGGGGQGTLTWTNGSTRTEAGTTTTAAYWSGNSNYNASPNSNSVNLVVNKAAGWINVGYGYATYNGNYRYACSEATGSGTITYSLNGGAASSSRPQVINAGAYTVGVYAAESTNYTAAATSGTFTMYKATGSVTTTPTAKSLTYNGVPQALVNAGAGTGTMLYKNSTSSTWSTDIPSGRTAGTYYVDYKASESTNYYESSTGRVTCSIAQATPTISSNPAARTGLVYNGSSQYLLSGGSASVAGSWSYASETNAGTYYNCAWTFTPNDSLNYKSVNGTVASATIAKLDTCSTISNWNPNDMGIGEYYTFSLSSGCIVNRWTVDDTSVLNIDTQSSTSCQVVCVGTGTTKVWAYNDGDSNYNSSSDWGRITVTAQTQQTDTIVLYPSSASSNIRVVGSGTTWVSAYTQSKREVLYTPSSPSLVTVSTDYNSYYGLTVYSFKGKAAGTSGSTTFTFYVNESSDWTSAEEYTDLQKFPPGYSLYSTSNTRGLMIDPTIIEDEKDIRNNNTENDVGKGEDEKPPNDSK